MNPRHSSWTPHLLALCSILIFFAAYLTKDIDRPWVDNVDFNGAVWSQSAHNILRAGLVETQGASAGFYFGPLPIPAAGYYLHHPPLLHLGVTAMFSIFGEHEWAARVIPIACSLASAVLLWFLVADCLGARTATFCTAVFTALPMMLHYGAMVNFEPVVFMLILMALLAWRYWEKTGRLAWKSCFLGAIFLGLWVDWPMYLFALVLAGWWVTRPNRDLRRVAGILLLMCAVSGLIYLIRIHLLRPDAVGDLHRTFCFRIVSDEHYRFTQWQWACKVGGSIVRHYLPAGLCAAALGAAIAFRQRNQEGVRWICWASLMIFGMDVIFVGVFQNDSYIHEYIAFYFSVPVAIMAGIALNETVLHIENALKGRFPGVPQCAGIILIAAGLMLGRAQMNSLQHRFCILGLETQESETFIPALGKVIRSHFSPKTRVLCNFMPYYGPHLLYYAKRDIASNLSEAVHWKSYLQKAKDIEVGGMVWMGNDDAEDILASLPPGKKEFVNLENERFCVWTPSVSTRGRGN